MSAILERSATSSSYHALTHTFPFGVGSTNSDRLRFDLPEPDNWLKDYKKTPGSIFKYYSVKNEFDFLKSAAEMTPEKQEFYIQENVVRYLGEFVGKIPYTTIRYDMDAQGFTYAGMHMMDSYRKAAEMTRRSREYAEVVGFQLIEDAFGNKAGEPNPPTTAKWISPPKDWDYGFEFIFKKGKDGKIVEYILRYPEKRGELIKSNELLHLERPNAQKLLRADDFLLDPLFNADQQKTNNDLDAVLKAIGIDEQKIAQSHYFEQQIEKVLGSWISEYAKRIVGLSKKAKSDVDYEWSIEQAEILLLSIYQQAQEIMSLYPFHNSSPVIAHAFEHSDNVFSQELLGLHALQLKQQKNLPQSLGGSCPAIEDVQSLDPATRFVSNHDIVTALKNGKKLEEILNGDSNEKKLLKCTCPGCKHVVVAVIENGTITCPRKACGNSAPYEC